MHDDVRGSGGQRRPLWSLGDERGENSRIIAGMAIGVLAGGAIGLLVDGYTMTALGISMGSGVGWGLSQQYRTARQRGGNALTGMAAGGTLGGVLGGLAGALTGWDVFILLGIAVGIALGANAGQRIGEP